MTVVEAGKLEAASRWASGSIGILISRHACSQRQARMTVSSEIALDVVIEGPERLILEAADPNLRSIRRPIASIATENPSVQDHGLITSLWKFRSACRVAAPSSMKTATLHQEGILFSEEVRCLQSSDCEFVLPTGKK
jgi:hypothetical protein